MSSSRLKIIAGRSQTGSSDGDPPRERLGELLTASGKISQRHLRDCLDSQRHMAVHLGELLCADPSVQPGDILHALRRQWSVGTLDLATEPPDPDLVARFGPSRCLEDSVLPWRRIGGATVIATVYPDRFLALRSELAQTFGPVLMALVLKQDLQRSVARMAPDRLNQRAETRLERSESCRAWTGRGFGTGMAIAWAGALGGLALAPVAALFGLTLLALLLLCAMTTLKFAAALRSRPLPRDTGAVPSPRIVPLLPAGAGKLPMVSLLVPVFRENAMTAQLVRRLSALDYPAVLLDICLIAEADDTATLDSLAQTVLPASMRIVVVPPGNVRTKPRALNYALDFCRGEIVGVYDAEDAPDPDQIRQVVRRFAQSGPEVACLQGRLAFYNTGQNILARCFAIEYATWFSVILPGLSRLGVPVPLGGTTLFFRRALLERLGAWDAHNVTEDADLGLRVARAGLRTELIDTTTREEANCRLWPWIRQRSRWIKGYAMTYATHMRRPRALLSDLGGRGLLGMQLLFLGSLAQALLAPLLWLWWLVPLGLGHPLAALLPVWAVILCSALLLIAEAVSLGISVLAMKRTGQMRLLPWALAMNPYHMLASLAALKALTEMLTRPFFWDKTEHGLARVGSGPAGTLDSAAA
jgi:cellulose synthase/poly-beta-1,6-N-acetylglucosamine synthase-like glycosyltransferase